MKNKLGTYVGLQQNLNMSFEIQNSLNMLIMNQKELENYINNVVQKNVCLEKNYSSSHVSKEKIYRYTSKFDGEYSEDPLNFVSVDSDDISLYESH